MSEEIVNTRLFIEAADAESIGEATRLRLVVEGQAEVVMGAAELVLMLLVSLGGEVGSVTDEAGNSLLPQRLDVLSAGDDPVE